jgi:hypothetical protein
MKPIADPGHEEPLLIIDHGEWPERDGRRRVLVENPDDAELWAHARVLLEAGYEVATCTGPAAAGRHEPWLGRAPWRYEDPQPPERFYEDPRPEVHTARTYCPLLLEGRCPLVEGADAVVTTTALTDGRAILATLRARSSPAVVVEGTSADLARECDVIDQAVRIREPVTPELLLAAVDEALHAGSAEQRPAVPGAAA